MRNLATVLVTDKESGQSAEVQLDELTNLTNSVVMLSVGPDEIASIEAQSGDLLITLNSGEAIIIAGFFDTPEGERNELVLEDANGILWWGQYDSPWSEFSFAEINLLDEAAKDQEIGWWLIAAGLGGAAAIAAAAGGGSSSSSPSRPEEDTTPPDAPSAWFNETGDAISGEAEPGSTVIVRDEDGNELGRTTADEDGSYTVELDEPLTNGEEVEVTATDEAGNESEPTTATAPDTTAPNGPSAEFIDTGDEGRGKAEPVTSTTLFRSDGNELGRTEADEDGNYTVELDEPLTNGEEVEVTATDEAGNVSDPTTAAAPDTTAPDAPTAEFNDTGDAVTGEAEPGSTVIVRDADGNELGRTEADEDGNYTVELDEPLTNGEEVEVTATDEAGNVSDPTTAAAPDTTAPDAPSAEFNDTGDAVSGEAEPGSTVIVRDADGNELGRTEAGEDGNYTVELDEPLTNGEEVEVTATDEAGNVSDPTTAAAPDTTAPDAPSAEFNDTGDAVSGEAEPGSTVIVRDADGNELGRTEADEDGNYTVELDEPLTNGEEVTVTATDEAGNVSDPTTAAAPDTTAPAAPTVAIGDGDEYISAAEIDADGNVTVTIGLPGDAEVGDTLTVNGEETELTETHISDGEVVTQVAAPGEGEPLDVTATVTDAAGNESEPGTASATVDTTAPVVTVNDLVTNETTPELSGTIDHPEATVEVTIDGATHEATNNGDGTWSLTWPDALDESAHTVEVVATDEAGNTGTAEGELTIDTTAPAAPTVSIGDGDEYISAAEIDADGNVTVTIGLPGDAEVGDTLTVNGEETELTETHITAGEVVTQVVAPAEGETLDVTATVTDAAGNESEPGTASATIDTTAPAAPTVSIGDGDEYISAAELDEDGNVTVTIGLSGTNAEAGDTLTVNGEETELTEAHITAGEVVTQVAAPAEGETLDVTATVTDAAGNESEPGTASATVDTTAPAAPTVSIGDGDEYISAAEIDEDGNVTVTIGLPGDAAAGDTLTVNGEETELTETHISDGEVVTQVAAPGEGEPLDVTATVTDAAGNESEPGTASATVDATAPDLDANSIAFVDPNSDGWINLDEVGDVELEGQLDADDNVTVASIVISDEAGGSVTVDAADITVTDGVISVAGQDLSSLADGELTVTMTVTDAAGNNAEVTDTIALDATAPAAPTLELANDTGDADGVTSDGTVSVGGLEEGATWEFSTDGGATWTEGEGTSFVLPEGTYEDGDVLARQTDEAGNTSGNGELGP